MVSTEQMGIIQHYIEELYELETNDIDENLSALLCISKGTAQEIIRLFNQGLFTLISLEKSNMHLKLLKKINASNGLMKYLISNNVSDKKCRVTVHHDSEKTRYNIINGMIIREISYDFKNNAMITCGFPCKRYRELLPYDDIGKNMDWYSSNVYSTNRVLVWNLIEGCFLNKDSLIFYSNDRYVSFDNGVKSLPPDQTDGPIIKVPLFDGVCMNTDIGIILVEDLIV